MIHQFLTAPIVYTVEITYSCRNNCIGCANLWRKKKNKSLYNWKHLFDLISPYDNRRKYAELIRISGGEPTLHQNFKDIVNYLDSFGVYHALFTTALWENPNGIIDIYNNCNYFMGMLISLHGSNQDEHNAFVGENGSKFEITCHNISLATSSDIPVYTNTVITNTNFNSTESIFHLSQDLGAEYAVFNRFVGQPTLLTPNRKQLKIAINKIQGLIKQGKPCRLGTCIPQCFVKNDSEGSNSGIEHCTISPDGYVRPNNDTNIVFGNIFDNTIEDIWKSDIAQQYRRLMPTDCLCCDQVEYCRGGLKIITNDFQVKKDPLMESPINENIDEQIEIDTDLVPHPLFLIKENTSILFATRMNWSIPFTKDKLCILEAINGKTKLEDIYSMYGDEALNIIALLVKNKFVEFYGR